MAKTEYTPQQLEQLHAVLHEILTEIIRVCGELHIDYFIQGGTAMGAYYEHDIMAWDDDIDIGMTRPNYERFLREAPAVLGSDYFLAWVGSDEHTPFYFAKVRKQHTLFLEETCQHIDMHHGIYVDIFPFDKVPTNARLEKMQRKLCNKLNYWLVAKEVWLWRYGRRCQIERPLKMGWADCMLTLVASTLLSKRTIYRWLHRALSLYDDREATYYNIVMMPKDHIEVEHIEHIQHTQFGPNVVCIPDQVFPYLQRHYGKNIQRIPPKDKQINHAPLRLSFDTTHG